MNAARPAAHPITRGATMRRISLLFAITLATSAGAQPLVTGIPNDSRPVPDLKDFIQHADQMEPFARTDTGRAFLDAVSSLPSQLRRYLWVDKLFTRAYTEAEYEALDDRQKRGLSFRPVTELSYYMGISERPLMDLLALDLAVTGTGMASPEGLAGKRILLYNPRVITQGRLLASLGADVTIVHDQQRMAALYNESTDTGEVPAHGEGPNGKLTLIRSAWPAEDAPEVGDDYDLIIVSDWVSRGLSIGTEAPPRWMTAGRPLRPLPTDPNSFIQAIAQTLAPGGRFLCYAYGPIQPRVVANAKPYSDVRFPVPKEAIEAAGLNILTLDADDTRRLLSASIATGFNEPMVRPDDNMPSMTAAYTLLTKPAPDQE